MSWVAPVTNWSPASVAGHDDLNRIETNIRDRAMFFSGTVGGSVVGYSMGYSPYPLATYSVAIPAGEAFTLRWAAWSFAQGCNLLVAIIATGYNGVGNPGDVEPDAVLYTNSGGSEVILNVEIYAEHVSPPVTLRGYDGWSIGYSIG